MQKGCTAVQHYTAAVEYILLKKFCEMGRMQKLFFRHHGLVRWFEWW